MSSTGSTTAAAATPIISPICIRHGVPPRMWPTLKSCIMSPATPAAQHTTPATPSTAAMPLTPVTPITTISTAAITSALKVSPEMGLFELPTSPTR